MENKRTNPFVTVQCDIVEEAETSSDSDATIPTQQSPSLKSTTGREKTTVRSQSTSPHENVSKLISSIQIPKQEATRARRVHNEQLAVIELNRGRLTMRAIHAPQETLREYLKKHIPTPIPSDDKNALNRRLGSFTLLHESVILRKHDITKLLLEHGADVNIYEQGQTVAHRAATARP